MNTTTFNIRMAAHNAGQSVGSFIEGLNITSIGEATQAVKNAPSQLKANDSPMLAMMVLRKWLLTVIKDNQYGLDASLIRQLDGKPTEDIVIVLTLHARRTRKGSAEQLVWEIHHFICSHGLKQSFGDAIHAITGQLDAIDARPESTKQKKTGRHFGQQHL